MATPERDRMTRIAETFPELRGSPGTRPFDAEALDRWACSDRSGRNGYHAALFVLGLWNEVARWQAGKFDLFRAMEAWDPPHVAACAAFLLSTIQTTPATHELGRTEVSR